MNIRLQLLFSLVVLALLSGCTSSLQTSTLLKEVPARLPVATNQPDLPFFPQDDYQCGPAALATVLTASGLSVTPDSLVSRVYVPGKTGSYQLELVTATRDTGRLAYPLQPQMEALLTELAAGHPVLVMQNLGLSLYPKWHFAVARGYDLEEKELILNSGTLENYRVSLKTFERTWARSEYWGIVVPAPGELPATAQAQPYFTALDDLEHNQPAGEILNAYYEPALERWPADANLLMGYGNLLYSQKKLNDASEVFSRVTLLRDDFAPAFNNLAWIQYELQDYDSALKNAERAVALGGEHSASYEDTYQKIALGIIEQ